MMKTADPVEIDKKVSIIIPVLNREKEIVRCLDSVREQLWRPLEVIIVDNGSSDSSETVVCEWKERFDEQEFEIKTFSHLQKGASKARNRGLKEATGEYVVFLDSDDTMRPELVSSAMAAIKKEGEGIVCWKCLQHLEGGKKRISPVGSDRVMERHLIHTIIHPLGCMASKEKWQDAGGWNESLSVWEDLEYGVRMLLKNRRVVFVDKVLGDVWWRKDSITGSEFSSRAGEWEKTLDEIGNDISGLPGKEKKKIGFLLSYRRVILASRYHAEGNYVLAHKYLDKAINKPELSWVDRFRLIFAYHYNRLGGRGAWRIIRLFRVEGGN